MLYYTWIFLVIALLAALFGFGLIASAAAGIAKQQHFHLELLTEHDLLQRTSYPAVHQHTTRVQITYGVSDRLEVGADGPLIAIFNTPASGLPTAIGFGDLDLQMKYAVRQE